MAAMGIHQRINAELERRRAASRAELDERRARAYAMCPGLEALEHGMALAGLEANRRLVAGDLAPDEARALLEGEVAALAARRESMLAEAGLPAGYLELAPKCALCGDTGLVRGDGPASEPAPCTCVRQMLADGLYEDSNLRAVGAASFELFDSSLYSDQPDAGQYGHAESPRENIASIRDSSQQYVQALLAGNGGNLYFFGRPGTGKTFMAVAIANAAMRGGATVLYQTAPALFGTVTEHRMRQYRDEHYSDARYRQILESDLLVIDDLGTESMTDSRYSEFITLLNIRLSLDRPKLSTIIVTNKDLRSFRDAYDERVISRVVGSFRLVPFYGEDIRLVKSRLDLLQ